MEKGTICFHMFQDISMSFHTGCYYYILKIKLKYSCSVHYIYDFSRPTQYIVGLGNGASFTDPTSKFAVMQIEANDDEMVLQINFGCQSSSSIVQFQDTNLVSSYSPNK